MTFWVIKKTPDGRIDASVDRAVVNKDGSVFFRDKFVKVEREGASCLILTQFETGLLKLRDSENILIIPDILLHFLRKVEFDRFQDAKALLEFLKIDIERAFDLDTKKVQFHFGCCFANYETATFAGLYNQYSETGERTLTITPYEEYINSFGFTYSVPGVDAAISSTDEVRRMEELSAADPSKGVIIGQNSFTLSVLKRPALSTNQSALHSKKNDSGDQDNEKQLQSEFKA